MISKLLNRRGFKTPQAIIPPGQRVYAVGDIHGCDALLADLIAMIDADDAARGNAQTTLIFLGDLVDRGPDSAVVVERLRQLDAARSDVRFLMGNHEEIFLGALAGNEKALRLFSRVGGRETALSYGIDARTYVGCDFAELQQVLLEHVPASHRAFLESFEDMIVIGDYAFVHAGVRPSDPLEAQVTSDLRWIREPFLGFSGTLEKTIVHGHTIADAVVERRHRVGIDTGAYTTGRLTAMGIEGSERWFLST